MRLHCECGVKTYRTQKMSLLCRQPCKRACMWVMQVIHPHNTFNLLMDFQVSKYKKPNTQSLLYFRIIGDVRFLNLSITCILHLSTTVFFSFHCDSPTRLVSHYPNAPHSRQDLLLLLCRSFQRVIFPAVFSQFFLSLSLFNLSLLPTHSFQPSYRLSPQHVTLTDSLLYPQLSISHSCLYT